MQFDIAIVGGGITGLATAHHMLRIFPGIRLCVIEKENALATHQSDRNSGVIHSGIYYKPHSAKARNCVKGHTMLIDFCREHDIPFDLCGKLIAATREAEIPTLRDIFDRGNLNGLTGLRLVDEQEAREIEPHCAAIMGIYVPQAGITNFRKVALTLADLIVAAGGKIFSGHQVNSIRENANGVTITSKSETFHSRWAIACAGLYADHLARSSGLHPPLKIVPFRGEFYALKPEAASLVSGLIYPVPDVNFPFLGVHLTRRIEGGVEAGPNAVIAFRREGYRHLDIHPGELIEAMTYPGFIRLARKHWRKGLGEMHRSFSKTAFLHSLQSLVPALQHDHISRSRAGVRAQALDPHGQLVDDYVVLEQDRSLHVCNAPSPAATSCLAIGEFISGLMSDKMAAKA